MQGPLKEHKNVQDENPALKRLQQDKENKYTAVTEDNM